VTEQEAEATETAESIPPNKQATKNRPKTKKCADYMNAYTFLHWSRDFQQSIVEKDPSRRILLLLDNVSCHTTVLKSKIEFPNINVMFLPPNTTSVTQPLDAGIIAVFKKRFRDLFSNLLVKRHSQLVSLAAASNNGILSGKAAAGPNNATSSRKASSKIKVLNNEARHFIVVAWDAVKLESIGCCFRHVPILCDSQKQEL
jgi:hypothetical protein